MILQALYRHYQLLQEREGDSMPGEEYSAADVSFDVHLNENGQIVAIIPHVNEKGKIVKQKHIVPKQDKRTSGIKPYFLCDKAEYLFGSAIGMRDACREAMKSLWKEVLMDSGTESLEIHALMSFLNLDNEQLSEQIQRLVDGNVLESLKSGGLCVLKFVPTGRFLHRDPTIQRAWENYYRKSSSDCESADEAKQICLITGDQIPVSQIARLHPSIKNVVGAQSSGAAIVSFNVESFCSYGHEQSYNAPTSQKSAEAYGFVLNKLLADPNHNVRINDTTVVFWADSSTKREEDWLVSLFQDVQQEAENSPMDEESMRTRVKSAVRHIRQGQKFSDTFHDLDTNTMFYVLGLSPNNARLAIRFWYTGTLGELGERVWSHYQDLSIIGLDRSPTIRELLREIAVGHDWSNIPPNMEGQMLRSILLDLPYSRAVFAQLMNRIRAESDDPKKGLYKIGAIRAAMIKAYLIRQLRVNKNTLEGEITMEINEQLPSVPYHLGRLFACLEKAQVSAQGQGLNATIRDRFWGAASATPANVFPRLLNLAQHHIAKDEEWGRVNDQRIQEVMNALPPQFPKRLSLEEQGMFALGYYHQRQDLYTKKSDK
ncbi:type I-C CRISPR-associated protein Cas8c/Csd1 [Sulfoacidibacillus thermotolerans]|uniref:Type I-C CRISPR-associated protein Cas8c/Csd1 n=1 Tax=Sulfoacidibacillus thermotolerans TaxID=1765684 RepID=A0A2U3D8H7_SULT2|nr:type I-C CRISPR-associated protein Cas8c/Csd1 [Sulfoacidibacillus thermotolerans]PWI57575.1 type I-C CRISPR-associated protein Cas8c/Csd1 [Sulfoacidibacillus thermotolerans]